MRIEDLKSILHSPLSDARINIIGSGENFSVEVISDIFANKRIIERQKIVLAGVKDQVSNGEIHSFTVRAYTSDEWDKQGGLLKVVES